MFLLLIIFSLCTKLNSESSESKSSINNKVDDFIFDYIEQIGEGIAKLKDEDLRSSLFLLLKDFKPGLEQIIQMKNMSKKMKLLKPILPELQNIENLLNHVNADDKVIQKNYRAEDDNISPIDAALLLTVYEQLEENESEKTTVKPPWLPSDSVNNRTTTKLPYKVN